MSMSISRMDNLRFKFPGSNEIKTSYSQVYQDLFVLAAHNGKKNGTYLEIGAGNPIIGNNTYLLESQFQWTGPSIDIDENWSKQFAANNRKQFILADALKLDFSKILSEKQIDYLSLDIDPSHQTLRCLKSLPLDVYRFSVITFEHDAYNGPTTARDESRILLQSLGYKMISGNISACYYNNPYEDWYLDTTVFDRNMIDKFCRNTDEILDIRYYMWVDPNIIIPSLGNRETRV